jgi:predicted  nucleic acid-binding Zn-ribbon protein
MNNQPTPNNDMSKKSKTVEDNALRQDLRDILQALQKDRTDVADKIDNVDSKLEGIRRENRAALDELRRDLQNYFLAKSEFVPYQQLVTQQFSEQTRRIERLEGRPGDLTSKALAFIAVGVSVLSVIITLLQHVSIHP